MPPYANTLVLHPNNDLHRMSSESVEPPLKRYLSVIDERFVQFEENVIIDCPQHHHQTKQCEQDLWYSAEELAQFRKNANRQGRQLQRRRFSSLPRGLELQTTQGLQRCIKNRLFAMAVVLELQYAAAQEKELLAAAASTNHDDYHHNMEDLYPETDSSEMIAKAYHEVTRHCQLQAMDTGLRDHMAAIENQHKEEEDSLQCNSSASCLNMPAWLTALLNKRASQQQY